MVSWIELKKKRYLTVEDMAALNNNFNYLRDYYLSFGLPVDELNDISVSHNISPADIQQIFNCVEQNIQTIQKVLTEYLHIQNKHFKIYTWEKHPKNLKQEVYRWIDWFNHTKAYVIGYINLKDSNGEIITDKNNEILQVLGAFKEEN